MGLGEGGDFGAGVGGGAAHLGEEGEAAIELRGGMAAAWLAGKAAPCYATGMSIKHEVVVSATVARLIESQIASGRYTDFSAAMQDAAWNYFAGSPSPFQEYKVTAPEVERSARADRARVAQLRAKGALKPWA